MVAGGSGASFTFGVALNILKSRKAEESSNGMERDVMMDFVWAVKDPGKFTCLLSMFVSLRRGWKS